MRFSKDSKTRSEPDTMGKTLAGHVWIALTALACWSQGCRSTNQPDNPYVPEADPPPFEVALGSYLFESTVREPDKRTRIAEAAGLISEWVHKYPWSQPIFDMYSARIDANRDGRVTSQEILAFTCSDHAALDAEFEEFAVQVMQQAIRDQQYTPEQWSAIQDEWNQVEQKQALILALMSR